MNNIIFTALFLLIIFVLSARSFIMNYELTTASSGLFFDSGGRDCTKQSGENDDLTVNILGNGVKVSRHGEPFSEASWASTNCFSNIGLTTTINI